MKVLLLLSALCVAGAEQVTPVQKVIQLLNDMLEKGKKEKHEEQVQFAAYRQFCEDTEAEKTTAIKEANQRIESLQAAIEKYDANVERLAGEIAGHEGDISTWQGDSKAAQSVRDIERTDYSATHKDYSESIDALERAVAVLKKQNFDRKQAAALMQLKLIPVSAKKTLDNFLQSVEDPLSVTAPEANGYEFQSGGVIEMLEKLHNKFEDERYTMEKEEANAKHAHQMLQQDLKAQISTATDTMNAKKVDKANNQQSAAESRGDLADTTTTRDDDQAYLNDLVATCKVKSSDFQSRQQLRAEEIEAVEKAIDILGSSSVTGNADKYLPALAQMALVQIKTLSQSPLQQRAVAFLSQQADKIHSRVLSALAVQASNDPFSKVRKMISDLIVRLQEEANEEAEHKGWCDTELATNEMTRKEKTQSVENLHATVDELEASIAKLTKDVAELSEQVANLDSAVKKATENRASEKATNEQTIKDAGEAQTAVAQALQVLKDFYAKAGQATALVQQQPVAPEIFDKPYTGMQSENGGIIGMLEVIQSDFARLETETKTSEATAQAAHDKFLSDSAVDKAQKNKDIEHKTNKKIDQSNNLTITKEDLASTQKELDAALRYYDKLKPSCVNAGVSYEDRVKRRQEELESLQEALKILNGEDI